MRRWLLIVIAPILAFAWIALGGVGAKAQTTADADGDGIEDARDRCPQRAGYPKHDGCPKRYVVRSWVHKPKRHVYRTRSFTPNPEPSWNQVKKIAAKEQRRWGGPSITGRIWCESTGRWWATNGQYRGLLQIGPWWSHAYPQTPRKVVERKTRKRKRPVVRTFVFNTGAKKKKIVWYRTQRVHIKKVGKLPKGASPYHGYAAIRVGQRAVSGHGPTTYWECGL